MWYEPPVMICGDDSSSSPSLNPPRPPFLHSVDHNIVSCPSQKNSAVLPCDKNLPWILNFSAFSLFIHVFFIHVFAIAEGDRLPCEVFSGVPLCCYHSPELSMEPASRHQGGCLWGGPALLCFHLQLHHVSQSYIVFHWLSIAYSIQHF